MSLPSHASRAELRGSLQQAIGESTLCLDERRFSDWLERTTPEFHYRIQAYSHDIRKRMTWLEHDRAGMLALIELLPKHHINHADWLRHVVVYDVTQETQDCVRVTSSLAAFHTDVDVDDAHVQGGSSRLFAVGRYYDRWRLVEDSWLLADRTVFLHTRQLGLGSHVFP